MRTLVLLAVLALAGACRGRAVEPLERGVQYTAAAGDTVTLRVGDELIVPGTGLRLLLRGVFNDSRCPVDVNCVWAGDADVRLDQRRDGGTSTTVEVHIHSEPRELRLNGMRVRLVDIKPPQQSQKQIRPEEYRVRLALVGD